MSTKPLRGGAIPLCERLSLAQEWDQFARTILPKGAPEVQRVETRRAFYAGAGAMFGLLTGGLDADHEPTDLDVAYVESLSVEIQAFAAALARGEA